MRYDWWEASRLTRRCRLGLSDETSRWCFLLQPHSARQMQAHAAFQQGYGLVISPGNFKSRMKRFEVEWKGMVVMIATVSRLSEEESRAEVEDQVRVLEGSSVR